ncbi:hypothetical protein [Mycobacteroides abscessus]|uniref:hypothetical protein n=1 Tax=Mycobacteroides abscessus TaxID=36809 RepID=UPI0009454A45|nr:hypothetical protein [Mycobacteroides abscessus]
MTTKPVTTAPSTLDEIIKEIIAAMDIASVFDIHAPPQRESLTSTKYAFPFTPTHSSQILRPARI